MNRFMPLLLEVWREACQHIEIGESVARIAAVLAQRLPLDLLIVRRLDVSRSWLETLAVGVCGQHPAPEGTRSELPPDAMERLVGWCLRAEVVRGHAAQVHRQWPGLLPTGLEGPVLAAPLGRGGEPLGVLILAAEPPRTFHEEHEEVLRALLEPLAVAVENDRRLGELRQLREAVEADNRSLLSRLGRQDIVDSIVGGDGGLRTVMERVAQVAHSDVPVLILGETGSGKEVVARAIHRRSGRANRPFLRVNCGAIPPELIDSELFGHERGSFTGAISMRKGWFERADGGTLFLDEAGELPAAAQVRLLRILQDGSFERVGGQQQRHVDVRVVAATNRDLPAMVTRGLFREDLWYRLAVFIIPIPSLRERAEDIASLAAHLALRAAKRFGTPQLVPTPADIERLTAYDWPGNVRELSSVMERAVILGEGRRLEVAKALGVHAEIGPSRAVPVSIAPPTAPAPQTVAAQLLTLDAVMRQHIEAALDRTHGRVEGPYGAARLLGINPHTLRARMRKLKVDWKRFRPVAGSEPGQPPAAV